MADYETAKKMVELYNQGIKKAIAEENPKIIDDVLMKVYAFGYGCEPKDKDFVKTFLTHFITPLSQALNVYKRDPINGLAVLADTVKKVFEQVVGHYLSLVPTEEESEELKRGIAANQTLEKILKELGKE